jgi:hypothetical protein
MNGEPIPDAQKNATRFISQKYDIEGPTISDLQTRRLEINGIDKFRTLLDDWLRFGNSEKLVLCITQHTRPEFHMKIHEFFGHCLVKANPEPCGEKFTMELPLEIVKKLKVLSIMADKSESCWLKDLAGQEINKAYDKWIVSQKNGV